MIRKLWFASMILTGIGFAQGVRYDVPPILGPTGQPLPNIAVALCPGTGAISGATCSPQTQSFSDITVGVPCALGNPVTLTASTQCQSTSDAFGNAGFWLSPGAYIFCLTGRGIAGSCYNLTVPAGSTPSGTLRSGPITAAGQVTVPDGTASAPSYSFTNQTATGFWRPATTNIAFSAGGTNRFNFGTHLTLEHLSNFNWSSGDPTSVGPDTGLSRVSAGQVAIGNGTQGDASGSLNLQNLTSPALGTATSGANVGSGTITLGGSSWNGSAAVSTPATVVYTPGTGANPNLFWSFQFPSTMLNGSFPQFANQKPATSGANVSSPGLELVGNSWTGSASQQDFVIAQDVLGSGANPSNSLVFSHGGGSGGFAVQVSSGTLQIGSSDTGLSRTAAGTVAVGIGTQGDASGTLKATTVNAVSGFQVNGTALAAANLSNGTTGSGGVVLATSPTLTSPTLNSPTLTTPNIGSASGNTLTFANQAAPGNPASGSITLYGDSGTGNITCRNSSGGSCLFATAIPPLVSGSANPAASGIVRVASGDTAVAFRNNANTADIAALTKNASDVVQVGGSPGATITSLGVNASPNGTAGDAIFSRSSTAGAVFLGSDGAVALFRPGGASNTAMVNIFGGQGITFNTAADTGLSRTAAGVVAVGNGSAGNASGTVNAATYQVAGTALAASNLSNGVTGSGAVALQNNAVLGHPQVNTGVVNSGSGMMHFRSTGTSCTTGTSNGSACATGNITLPGTFADTNYTVVCNTDGGSTGSPVIAGVAGRTTTTISLIVVNTGSGVASSYGTADCILIHD